MNGSDDEYWIAWLLQFAFCEALLGLKEGREVGALALETLFASLGSVASECLMSSIPSSRKDALILLIEKRIFPPSTFCITSP